MKFFAIFAAVLAVAASHSTWTLNELSEAIQSPNTDPAMLPYLEEALNNMMDQIYTGVQVEAVTVTVPAVTDSWTLGQISDALQNPETDPALIPYLEQALNNIMDALISGNDVTAVPVIVPALEVTHWTLNELSEALQNPATNPALVPYLEHALNEMMESMFAGNQMEAIVVAIPAGLEPVVPVVPVPAVPVVPTPVEAEVAAPVIPTTTPLVQIVLNIKQSSSSPIAASAVVPVARA